MVMVLLMLVLLCLNKHARLEHFTTLESSISCAGHIYTLTHVEPLKTCKPVAVEYATIPVEGDGIADARAAVPAYTCTI
jgi:hypothetical protein